MFPKPLKRHGILKTKDQVILEPILIGMKQWKMNDQGLNSDFRFFVIKIDFQKVEVNWDHNSRVLIFGCYPCGENTLGFGL